MSSEKILLSGVKSTGKLHIGNYFGAIRQFVELQEKYKSYVFIADLHALTTVQNAGEMSQNILDIAIDYLALGLDPEKVVLFKQSDIPEHAELAWIFDCITTMPYLARAHAYKDALAKSKEVNVGVFNYPILMAADILLYDTDVVPVGQDQKQHVEYARDTAEKFNRIFGETFKLPEPLILEEVAVLPGIDGRKMSKSYGNTIEIFEEDENIKKKVMSIPTDSKGIDEPKDPEKCNIFAFHKLLSEPKELAEIRERYEKGGIGYKESKEILVKNMTKFIAPLREKREKIAKDKNAVLKILKNGGLIMRDKMAVKMADVRKKVGLSIYSDNSL